MNEYDNGQGASTQFCFVRLLTEMKSSQESECSTARKTVAVVLPRRRSLTNGTEHASARSPTTSESVGTRNGEATPASTERRRHEAPAASVHSGRQKTSENRSGGTREAARWNDAAADRQTSTCIVTPSRRPVERDEDDDLTACPFYHGNITSVEARRRLADKSCGTYLLRDSQSNDFPFSLSLRTSGASGVTSLRIARDGDQFRLDCDESGLALMPKFDGVLRLVRHFVAESDGGEGGRCALVGTSGRRHERPLQLRQPLQRPARGTTD